MKLTWLKEFFAGFLRSRHIARDFRRLALLDTLVQTGVSREVPVTLAAFSASG
jgi:P-type Mg2+ transporter